MTDLVLRLVSSRRGILCCEWIPWPDRPVAGDYVWASGHVRIFDGARWL